MWKGKGNVEKEIMSFRVPDFVPDEDNPIFPHKIHTSAGDDVDVELVWQKGLFLRRRSPDPPHGDYALRFLSDPRAASGVSTTYSASAAAATAASLPSTTELFMEEDEMASWLYYPSIDGDDDADGVGTVAGTEQQPRDAAAAALQEQGFFPPAAVERAVEADGWAMTGRPPRHPQGMSTGCLGSPLPLPASRESTAVNASATTSSRLVAQSRVSSGSARVGAAACELGPASSSGLSCDGEEAAAGAASMAAGPGDKRKRRTREDDGCDSHSEDGEFESSSAGKRGDSGRSASARKSRAAQVHNLSERRRRDRINEKMKALQQLIPRCHKSDKASMLDDAIEYMKSLQMQVQMMSMCCNMAAPMMFPGVMPSMGMGMPAPMGMNMGMRVGMAMMRNMDMSSTGPKLGHPMMPPCPAAMPAAQMAANGAPHLSLQRRQFLAAYAPVAAALAEQMRLQQVAANHADPASSSTCITTPGAPQMPKLPAFVHRARSDHEDPASATATEPGRRTDVVPDESRLG